MGRVPEWKRRQRAARRGRGERTGVWLGRILLGIAAACAAATVAWGGPRTGQVTVKRDWTAGWSDLERLVRAKSVPKYIAESVRPEMYPRPGDRDPVDVRFRQTKALLASVARLRPAADLTKLRIELAELEAKADFTRSAGEKVGRREFEALGKLYWRISLAGPMRGREKILFIKRHKSRRSHMCDQFLGRNARAGGGLYLLSDAVTDTPKLTDVLADSVVSNGRLMGKKLVGGAFLSPDLSYDGKRIVFAYCECGKDTNRQRPGWNLETCFHLFRVNVDGTDLVQLTDGLYNDFDPCWLPNGRICFISERRGGYGRCHGSRDAPSYTLCSVHPDGGDLVLLSYGEANEWHPSVTNDGRIVYTRWDYVDRGTNQAHHPWITSMDGRDARAIHGNYPPTRRALHDRPWMEMDIRAIPGSTRFVATTAGHHGQAYGSLVIIDPDVEDDDARASLRRLTPEAAFPESERGRGGDFATAWPISEDHFLAAYRGGIHLVDTFGGRQLIYHSSDVPCLSPIPVRPRRRPPLVPHQTTVGSPSKAAAGQRRATVALMNIYEGRLPWPKDTKITGLRIIQLFPKATPRAPDCGTGRTNIRQVLGTVPVESDGSAHFYAPTNKAVYFQALDQRGLAVQSMRSLTYVHPGERLVCQGCHENRWRAPRSPRKVPLALRREPSEVRPDVEGSNPWNYKLLVEAVIKSKCDTCHRQKAKSVRLDASRVRRLVPHYTSPKPFEPSRTVPGKFGALGSKLLKYLDKSHHGVKLTGEEFHRLTLWMDCNLATTGPDRLTEEQRTRLVEFAPPSDTHTMADESTSRR